MERLFAALEGLLTQLRRYALPIAGQLQPGLSPAAVATLLQGVPGHVSQEVQGLYQWHNGEEPGASGYLLPHYLFYSLEQALAMAQQERASAAEQAAAPRGVPATWTWDPVWFPLFMEADGTAYYVVGCQPTPHATAPIYHVSFEVDGGVSLAYDSLTHLFETEVRCYETGAYWVEEDPYGSPCVVADPRRVAQATLAHNPQRTAWWLGTVPGAPGVEALPAFLGQTDSHAFAALRALGDPRTIAPLLQVLQHGPLRARSDAAYLLGEFGDARAVEPLIAALEETSGRAAIALGCLGDSRAVAPLCAALEAALQTGDAWEIQGGMTIAHALGALGDGRAVEPLLRALQEAAEPHAAIWALGELRARQAVPALLHALQTPGTRGVAAVALGKIGDRRAVEALTAALIGTPQHRCGEVAEALGKLGDRRAVEALCVALATACRADDGWASRMAAKALGQLGDPRAIEPLLQAFPASNELLARDMVAWALGALRARQAVPVLLQALHADDAELRAAAAEALGQIGDRRAVATLIETLADVHPRVRWMAAQALGHLGDARALTPLVGLQQDAYEPVQHAARAAWEALQRQRPADALERE